MTHDDLIPMPVRERGNRLLFADILDAMRILERQIAESPAGVLDRAQVLALRRTCSEYLKRG